MKLQMFAINFNSKNVIDPPILCYTLGEEQQSVWCTTTKEGKRSPELDLYVLMVRCG